MITISTNEMIRIADKIPYNTYKLTDDPNGPAYVGQIRHINITVGQFIEQGIRGAFIKCESEGQFLGHDSKVDASPNPILNLYQRIHEAVDPVRIQQRAQEQRISEELADLLKEE
nr:hypothetical protein [Nanoarchaeum sp.]